MDNEVKWFVLLVGFILACGFGGLVFSAAQAHECRLKAIEAKMAASDVAMVCQ